MQRKAAMPLLVLAVFGVTTLLLSSLGSRALSKPAAAAPGVKRAESALTIYNQNFAVVRQPIPLDLKEDINNVRFTGATAHLEPDSVILRDPAGAHNLQILEQNYRADPVSQELLLSMFEGKTLEFEIQRDGKKEIIRGTLVRSGYVPHPLAWRRYGEQYYRTQMAMLGPYSPSASGGGQPIVEIDGKLHFGLPGRPIFPSLGQDTILKPTLDWLLRSDKAGTFDAELSYVTGGMSWEADYNIVAPPEGDILDVVGWVTMDNQSGKIFENAQIQLMAGDVSKLQPGGVVGGVIAEKLALAADEMRPPVSERTFDEYHLYSLHRRVTLHDRETKQVEFLRASGVKAQRLYVYDGARIDRNRYQGWPAENILQDRGYGTETNPKVWVVQEFANSKRNHLGMPLPKGRVRFYRRDESGQLQFTGENAITHTPSDETVRLYTGNAFDLVGERRRTNYRIDTLAHWLDESFEIKLRNHKKETVEVRMVEHLYRWHTWQITEKTNPYIKTDSQTIEFRVPLAPNREQTVTYTVHYTW